MFAHHDKRLVINTFVCIPDQVRLILVFLGVGTGKGGKLEYSDDYKFVEDLRTYKIKFYGTGRPYDINAFMYLDITNLVPVLPAVQTVNP